MRRRRYDCPQATSGHFGEFAAHSVDMLVSWRCAWRNLELRNILPRLGSAHLDRVRFEQNILGLDAGQVSRIRCSPLYGWFCKLVDDASSKDGSLTQLQRGHQPFRDITVSFSTTSTCTSKNEPRYLPGQALPSAGIRHRKITAASLTRVVRVVRVARKWRRVEACLVTMYGEYTNLELS